MQKKVLLIACVNGHQASHLCFQESCLHPAPICQERSCEYSIKHQNCMTTTKASVFMKNLINRRALQSTEADKILFGLICKLIKVLEVLRDQYLNSNKDSLVQLPKNQKEVLELIERGQIKDLKPILISDVIKTLSNKEDKESKEHLLKIKEITQEVEKNIQNEINKIRRLVNLSKVQPYLFSKQLCDSSLMSISNEGKTIQRIKENNDQNVFSLVSPSLSETSNRKIRLKLNRLERNQFILGMASKSQMLKSNFKWIVDQIGVYAINSDGWFYNRNNTSNHLYSDFQFNQAEEIEMEYFPSLSQMKVTNLSSKQEYTLNNITDDKQDLCFAIDTLYLGQQIEIIEQK